MTRRHWSVWLIGITTLLLGGLYWSCMDTKVVGVLRDDGIYAILGKALASGQGFHLIHLPLNPPQGRYPILYPLILSLGWWINPKFPANIPLLNGLTVFFSIASFPLGFYYFRICKKAPIWLAWLLVLFTASALLPYGTLLMSEGPYLFFSLLALFYAESQLSQGEKKEFSQKTLYACAFLSALVFHTRIIGLTLIMAIALWLACQKRYKDCLMYFLCSTALTILPWGLWTAYSQLPLTVTNYALLRPYSNYSFVFASLTQNPAQYWQTLTSSLGSFIMALLQLFFPVLNTPDLLWPGFSKTLPPLWLSGYFLALLLLAYGITGYLLLQILQALRQAFTKKKGAGLSIAAFYISLYCLLILVWNFESHLGRFLLVIAPWLWFYLLSPVLPLLPALKRICVLGLISILALYTTPWTYHMLASARKNQFLSMNPQFGPLWKDYQSTFSYLKKHLPPQAAIGAFYETTVYLYTQHPTIFAFFPTLRTQHGIPLPTAYQEFLDSMQAHGVRYFLMEPQLIRAQGQEFPENLFIRQLIEQNPQQFQRRYISPHGLIQLYERHTP